MAIKATVREHEFRAAFKNFGCENQFSYDGLGALFEYLESMSDDLNRDIELDVIALCYDFHEETLESFIEEHEIDIDPYVLGEDSADDIIETFRENYVHIIAFKRKDRFAEGADPLNPPAVDSIIVSEG